jgi:hypothetical protein
MISASTLLISKTPRLLRMCSVHDATGTSEDPIVIDDSLEESPRTLRAHRKRPSRADGLYTWWDQEREEQALDKSLSHFQDVEAKWVVIQESVKKYVTENSKYASAITEVIQQCHQNGAITYHNVLCLKENLEEFHDDLSGSVNETKTERWIMVMKLFTDVKELLKQLENDSITNDIIVGFGIGDDEDDPDFEPRK